MSASGQEETEPKALTIGEAAAEAGVTVRTLHHWDAIGLVTPTSRTAGGYRLYSASDLRRIRRVLRYQALGLPLAAIRSLLEEPSADRSAPLRQQQAEAREQIGELKSRLSGLDRLIEATESGLLLTAEEQVAMFGPNWQPDWAAQAHDRWGDTDQWAQYAEQAAAMNADDWKEIAARTAELEADLAAALRAGVEPGGAAANDLAERHRASIAAYFDCTHSMHVLLGRMYVADEEFAAYYNAICPGLATWLHAAIDANVAAHGIDPATATWA